MDKINNIKVFACGETPNSIVKSKSIITNQFEKYVQVNNNSFFKYYIKSFLGEDENFVKCIGLYDKHEKSNLSEVEKALGNLDVVIILGNLKDKHCVSNIEIISKLAREKGALAIAMVLIPYSTDKSEQLKYNSKVQYLSTKVDTFIPLLAEELAVNSNMPLVNEEGIYFPESYMLFCIEQLMQFFETEGLVKLDKEDFNAIFKDSGLGYISIGGCEGEDNIEKVTKGLVSNNAKLIGCNKLLIGISGDVNMNLSRINDILERIQATVSPDCNIIFVAFTDDELKDKLMITIIGIENL